MNKQTETNQTQPVKKLPNVIVQGNWGSEQIWRYKTAEERMLDNINANILERQREKQKRTN